MMTGDYMTDDKSWSKQEPTLIRRLKTNEMTDSAELQRGATTKYRNAECTTYSYKTALLKHKLD